MQLRLALALSLAVTATVYASRLLHLQDGPVRPLLASVMITALCLWIVRRIVSGPVDRLAAETTRLAQSLTEARQAAEREARLRHEGEAVWTADRLKEHVKSKLDGRALFVAANREPYEHIRVGRRVEVRTPASGLVTGIEPVLRACGGVWVAQATGSADAETVDEHGHVQVPPDDPQYTLRRVWLTGEEEDGYYYGFANEGLWPLCHIAHTRPLFETQDWEQYRAVNAKFAAALIEEMAHTREPWVLIQDYHFALLPRLIKEARPDARVAIFWHIPWTNPEAFDICPWRKEILDGMLGADIIGFHIQFHCNNFLETVDRTLECRVDWERFAVKRSGHTTLVKPFPISIAFPSAAEAPSPAPSREALARAHGAVGRWLGVGVDRVDYTKGIVERFRGIERFFEKYPEFIGQFCFLQVGAPSRTLIPRYHDLMTQVELEAGRINARFATKAWKPIVFLKKHHSHSEIEPLYRAADLCMVTSLHDGMNLVAKEFVASRDDERGVLILSRFTGAARELREALIVNPYDVDQMAESIRSALAMEPREQTARMRAMRATLREQNVYLWAARLIDELSKIPSLARTTR